MVFLYNILALAGVGFSRRVLHVAQRVLEWDNIGKFKKRRLEDCVNTLAHTGLFADGREILLKKSKSDSRDITEVAFGYVSDDPDIDELTDFYDFWDGTKKYSNANKELGSVVSNAYPYQSVKGSPVADASFKMKMNGS